MGSALIGVLGVIIGALLTTALTIQRDTFNRKRGAIGAGRLLASDLRNTRTILGVAADTGRWFEAPLATNAWQAYSVQVAADLPDVVYKLARTYEILRNLNAAAGFGPAEPDTQLAQTGGTPPPPQGGTPPVASWRRRVAHRLPPRGHTPPATPRANRPDALNNRQKALLLQHKKEIGSRIQELEDAIRELDEAIGPLARKRLWRSTGWVAAAAFVAFSIFALLPRAQLTPESIGQALIEQLDVEQLDDEFVVDCDTAGNDWVCHITQFQADGSGTVVAEADFDATHVQDQNTIVLTPQPEQTQPDPPDEPAEQWELVTRELSTEDPPITEPPVVSWWDWLRWRW
jgi:hypothetical protein